VGGEGEGNYIENENDDSVLRSESWIGAVFSVLCTYIVQSTAWGGGGEGLRVKLWDSSLK
jgi:hypothetical protein